MPYGIPKSKGGDSRKNVERMEKCVSKISGTNNRTGRPYTKSEKIAICKAQLFGKNSSLSDDYIFDESLLRKADMISSQYLTKKMSEEGLSFESAQSAYETALARANFDFDRIKHD